MTKCHGIWHVVQCNAECFLSCLQLEHLHGGLLVEDIADLIRAIKWLSLEWWELRVDASCFSWLLVKEIKPLWNRCHCSLARARFRRWDLRIVLFAVVKVSQENVALYKSFLRDNANCERSASQVHLDQNRCQNKEEQNCLAHTQKPSSCPAIKATQDWWRCWDTESKGDACLPNRQSTFRWSRGLPVQTKRKLQQKWPAESGQDSAKVKDGSGCGPLRSETLSQNGYETLYIYIYDI